jgi:hypothetical protein
MSGKERAPNDLNSPFKEKEKEGGERRSQLGGQWKEKEKEKHLFTSSHFPPTNFT